MGLPDFTRCIATLPDELKCSVLDADGQSHAAAITSVSHERGVKDYGFPVFGTGDAVYVPLPFRAPKASLDRVVKAMPALHAPTVNALHGGDWFAVESVVEERKVRDLIPALKSAGATGILIGRQNGLSEKPRGKKVFPRVPSAV